MQDGMAAAAAARIVGPLLDARRANLIRDIVARARHVDPAKRVTKAEAYVFVLALASTYDLEDDMKKTIEVGTKAGQHFTR